MTVFRITRPGGPNPDTRQPEAQAHVVVDEPVASRALVAVKRTARTPAMRPSGPDASFVAHLIAMANQAPQTRVLRRATSADAQAIYHKAAKGNETGNGKVLSQTA